MTLIAVRTFDGLRPISHPRLLGESNAQVAQNVRLISGALNALKGTTTVKSTATGAPVTIFRYGNGASDSDYWLEFSQDTDVMRSPIADDQWQRLYWTDGNNVPRYAPNSLIISGAAYPGGSYILGVPAPSSAPTISVYTAPPSGSVPEYRTYVYTYVTAYGEEGPPSPASSVVQLDPTHSATLIMSGPPGGAYNIATKRIYRSSTVGNNAQFQFVAEVAANASSYTDSISQSALGEVLQSELWYGPPAGLAGLRMMANGVAVGFKGKTVYFSEPNLPHAWPNNYTIDEDIVGIATFGQSVAVLTKSFPYLMSGVDPAAMTTTKLKLSLACSSKRSIVETDVGAIYASPQGLVSIGNGGIDVISKGALSKAQWTAYNPSSMQSYQYNGLVLVMYSVSGVRGTLVFDLSGQGAAFTTTNINQTYDITAAFYDPKSDILYMAQNGSIIRFDQGSALTFKWRSKMYRLPRQENFGVAQVRADAYPVTLRVYRDGSLAHTQTVASANQFRLPSGFRALDWELEVEGSSQVTEIFMATSSSELQSL